MKTLVDRHHCEVVFAVGDFVYLKLQPYKQTSVAFRASLKLAPRYYGPYQVLERVGTVAYKLALPPSSKIHNVFHMSLLRKQIGVLPVDSQQLPPISDEAIMLPRSEAILDRQVPQKGCYRPKTEVLIKWQGLPKEDATWEHTWRLAWTYPDFLLEDKES